MTPENIVVLMEGFALGLLHMKGRIVSWSFYNSSCGEASFRLISPLTAQESRYLTERGFGASEGATTIYFSENP
jgi:hypothetical protein